LVKSFSILDEDGSVLLSGGSNRFQKYIFAMVLMGLSKLSKTVGCILPAGSTHTRYKTLMS
jgi:hypothetical protein